MINMAAFKRLGKMVDLKISIEAYSELNKLATQLAINAIKEAKKDKAPKLKEEHFKE